MKRKFLLVCGLVGLTLSQWAMTNASAQRPQRGGDDQGERGGQRGGERGGQRGGERGGDRGNRGGDRGRGGGPGGSRGGGDSESALLRSAEVREELELTSDQEEAIKELEKRGQERPQGDADGFDPRKFDFQNASEEEKAEFIKKIQAMRKEQTEKRLAQLEEVLFPEQMERLSQLVIQLKGMAALADPEVQKQVGITDEQLEELKQMQSEQNTKMRESMREIWEGGDRESMREKIKEMRDEAEAAVMAKLEPGQREKFDELKGEPFDFSSIQRSQGGRGGRGGGGDRGAGGGGRGGDRGAGGGGGDRGAGARGTGGGRRPGGLDSEAQD